MGKLTSIPCGVRKQAEQEQIASQNDGGRRCVMGRGSELAVLVGSL